MKIETVPIGKLNPAAYNPRKDLKPGDPEYESLRKSIETFDSVEPVVWNKRTGNIVGGHQRFKILKARGDKKVTVSVVDLDAVKEKALNIALNKITGDWDIPLLKDLLVELDTGAFDLTLTGFDEAELKKLIDWDGHLGETADDEVPPIPKTAVTKPGDLWVLGDHRVVCGDATNKGDVERVLGDIKPVLMVTDPPYGVDYDPAWRQEAAEKGLLAYSAIRVGEVTNDERVDWREAWALFPGDVVYCWHADRHASEVQESLKSCGFIIRNQIIWSKSNFPVSRGHYHWRHEPCWYAVREGKTAHWIGDHTNTTVWEANLDKNVEGGHSTQKPVELMAHSIRNHDCKEVYDPFLGSGTTMIAAEKLNRRCFGLEIEPKYCDVIVERWQQFTGEKAVRK